MDKDMFEHNTIGWCLVQTHIQTSKTMFYKLPAAKASKFEGSTFILDINLYPVKHIDLHF